MTCPPQSYRPEGGRGGQDVFPHSDPPNDTVDMGAYELICTEVDRVKLSCPDADTLEASLKAAPPGGGG